MITAALVVLGDAWPSTRLIGLEWPEFRLRQMIAPGINHFVLLTDRVAPDVVRAIDRLRGDGVNVALARTARDAADMFHPDDHVLVAGGHNIVRMTEIDRLGANGLPAVLCAESGSVAIDLELIDGRHGWTGFACVQGSRIRALAPIAGEWDLASALMRDAVRQKAARVVLPETAIIVDGNHIDRLALARWLTSADSKPAHSNAVAGWGEQFVTARIARAIAIAAEMAMPVMARRMSLGIFTVLSLMMVAAVAEWRIVTCALMFVCLIMEQLRTVASRATAICPRFSAALPRVIAGVGGVAVIAVSRTPIDNGPLAMAFALVLMTIVLRRDQQVPQPRWHADVAGDVIMLAVSSIFGATGFATGLFAATLFTFVSIMRHQRSG